MSAIFVECEKYNRLKKKDCIAVFWKIINRVINQTTQKLEKKKQKI